MFGAFVCLQRENIQTLKHWNFQEKDGGVYLTRINRPNDYLSEA